MGPSLQFAFVALQTVVGTLTPNGNETPKPQPSWKHAVLMTGGGSVTAGNTETLTGNYRSVWSSALSNRIEWKLETQGRYGESRNIKTLNRHSLLANPQFLFSEGKYSISYSGTVSTAEFQNIRVRTTHEIGISWRFLRNHAFLEQSVTFGPMYEYELSWNQRQTREAGRLSLIQQGTVWFDEARRSSLSNTFLFSFKIGETRDYRSRLLFNLKTRFGKYLISENRFQWDYTALPLTTGIQSADYSFTTSIGFEL
jgi:hypothetical protein